MSGWMERRVSGIMDGKMEGWIDAWMMNVEGLDELKDHDQVPLTVPSSHSSGKTGESRLCLLRSMVHIEEKKHRTTLNDSVSIHTTPLSSASTLNDLHAFFSVSQMS
jgi:hypothetical protein